MKILCSKKWIFLPLIKDLASIIFAQENVIQKVWTLTKYLSFICIMSYITVIDLHMLNYPYIPGIKSYLVMEYKHLNIQCDLVWSFCWEFLYVYSSELLACIFYISLYICILLYNFVWLRYQGNMLVAQLHPNLCEPMDCSLPGSSVHGIFQTRILEWVVVSSSRRSSWPSSPVSPALIDIFFTTELHGN